MSKIKVPFWKDNIQINLKKGDEQKETSKAKSVHCIVYMEFPAYPMELPHSSNQRSLALLWCPLILQVFFFLSLPLMPRAIKLLECAISNSVFLKQAKRASHPWPNVLKAIVSFLATMILSHVSASKGCMSTRCLPLKLC